MMAAESILLATEAGHEIAITLFRAESPKGVVVVAGAMGVVQYHYAKFCLWLCGQGYSVVTFDYHGTGASIGESVRDCRSGILDWARYDCPAVIDFAQSLSKNSELIWFGHSVGGQIVGMLPSDYPSKLTRVVTIACGNGYWLENALPTKRIAWFLWYFVAPISTFLCGYYPGKRLNLVGDLPKTVMQQWRRWCLNPEYSVGAEGPQMREKYAAVTTPITSLSFSDDEMMSRKSIDSLHGFYTSSPKTMICIKPHELGLTRIGHLGWSKDKFKDQLWQGPVLLALQGA